LEKSLEDKSKLKKINIAGTMKILVAKKIKLLREITWFWPLRRTER